MQRFALSLACGLGMLTWLPGGATAGWEADFESARAEAKESGRPLLIHFYADWCGPCRQMEASVLNSADVLEACGTKCVAVKVNLDHHKEIARTYGVAALPTDVFVSPDGKVLSRNVGKASVNEYVARMDEAAQLCAPLAGAGSPGDILTPDVAELLTKMASNHGVGLKGYSPVALTEDHVWTEGSPDFACRHAGVMYYLADAAELAAFKKEPEKYAPRYSGFDPLILSVEGVAVPGLIVYGSFYKGRLHLHATNESRESFLKDPSKYPAPKEMEVPEMLAKKTPVVAEIPAG